MSALSIYEDAPIGAIVSRSDGTPRPPERNRKKLSAWHNNNSRGQLIRKQGERGIGTVALTACFTLHEAVFGKSGVVAIRVHRTFSIDSAFRFAIEERPALSSIRVFDRPGDDAEPVHLAPHRAAAEEWLSRHGYPRAVLEEVTADEVAADVVEGRAAA